LHLARGQHVLARSHYDQALSIAEEVGDRRWEGSARSNLGLLCQELGDADQAFDHFSRALVIAKEIGDIRLEYVLQCNLGIFFGKQSEHAKAIAYLRAAAQAAQSNNDLRSEGQFRGYLAVTLARLAQFADATLAWNTAKSLLSTVSDRLSMALLTSQGAEIQLLSGNIVNAAALIASASLEAQELRVEAGSELATAIDAVKERLRSGNAGIQGTST
ncbi:MAG TPA: tetratricopeptide repeat protein, partial [Burkholderiaceae bacterium]|nr:tetratricopeptide repeat protein [Burkholderiaceae bacterium]